MNSRYAGQHFVTLLFVTLSTSKVVWDNLGYNECYNVLGQFNETCGHHQFCSKDPIAGGCRNCTDDDFHIKWCSKSPEVFRNKYPTCEVLCERELWKRNVSLLQNYNDDLSKQNSDLLTIVSRLNLTLARTGEEKQNLQERLRQETEKTTNLSRNLAIIIIFFVLLLVIVGGLAFHWRRQWKGLCQIQGNPVAGTASPESGLCCSPWRVKKRHPKQIQEDTTTMLLHERPSTPGPTPDSGHASETNSNATGSSGTLSDRRAPSGQGVEHHINDAEDFMDPRIANPSDSSLTPHQTPQPSTLQVAL